jgi:hypothetical protein
MSKLRVNVILPVSIQLAFHLIFKLASLCDESDRVCLDQGML